MPSRQLAARQASSNEGNDTSSILSPSPWSYTVGLSSPASQWAWPSWPITQILSLKVSATYHSSRGPTARPSGPHHGQGDFVISGEGPASARTSAGKLPSVAPGKSINTSNIDRL